MAPRLLVLLAATLLAACKGRTPAPASGPCERVGTFEVRAVDSDTPYMRQLFTQVGIDRAGGAATDPTAAAAGIRAEIDQWTTGSAGERRSTDYYLFATDRAALERYLAQVAAPLTDREIRLERIIPTAGGEGWRTYLLKTPPVIATRHLAEVHGESNPATGTPMLRLVLTPEGTAAFAAGTAAAIGHKLAIVLDGVVLSAPIVESSITGGQVSITVRPWQTRADLLARLACRR